MATIDTRYQNLYPYICARLASHPDKISTLNKLADQIFSNSNFFFSIEYNVNCKSYAELNQQSFNDLTKEIDAYNKNQTRKLLLIGAIAVACLVGAAAKAVFGFAALGCALTATFSYYPFDSQLNIMKIKAALSQSDAYAWALEELTAIKQIFTPSIPEFETVDETFYTSVLNLSNQQVSPDVEEPKKRKALLLELARRLNEHKKLINPTNGQIFNTSLDIILAHFNNYLATGNYSQTVHSATTYISKVTVEQLEAGTLPHLDIDGNDEGVAIPDSSSGLPKNKIQENS